MNETKKYPNIEDYEIICPIGEGGMGQVYLATCKHTNCRVAIKFIHSDLSAKSENECRYRFVRESSIAKEVKHPNIAMLLDSGGFDSNHPYLVFEYLEGESLDERLTVGKLSELECKKMLKDLLNALSHIHSLGLVHRDIKPANVFLTSRRGVKLLDFGLALDVNRTRLTETGMIVGTFLTMAPEVISNDVATIVSDFYSLGVTLYFAATGTYPYSKEEIIKLSNGVYVPAPIPPHFLRSDFSEEFSLLIMGLLAWDKRKRLSSHERVLKTLEEPRKRLARKLLSSLVNEVEKPQNPSRHNYLSYFLISLLLLCTTFIYGFSLPGHSPKESLDKSLVCDLRILRKELIYSKEMPTRSDCHIVGFTLARIIGNYSQFGRTQLEENGLLYLAEAAGKRKLYTRAHNLYIALLKNVEYRCRGEFWESVFLDYCTVLSHLSCEEQKREAIEVVNGFLERLPLSCDVGAHRMALASALKTGQQNQRLQLPSSLEKAQIRNLELAIKQCRDRSDRQSAALLLCKALMEEGKYVEALTVFKSIHYQHVRAEEQAIYFLVGGQLYRGLEQYGQAVNHYREGLRHSRFCEQGQLKAKLFETIMLRMAAGQKLVLKSDAVVPKRTTSHFVFCPKG